MDSDRQEIKKLNQELQVFKEQFGNISKELEQTQEQNRNLEQYLLQIQSALQMKMKEKEKLEYEYKFLEKKLLQEKESHKTHYENYLSAQKALDNIKSAVYHYRFNTPHKDKAIEIMKTVANMVSNRIQKNEYKKRNIDKEQGLSL